MYKVLVSDLDGTLLGIDHKISEPTVTLLRKLHDKGIDIVVATGRTYIDAMRIKEELGFDLPMITSNGAELTDEKGKLIFKILMKKEDCKYLIGLNIEKYSDEIFTNLIVNDKWKTINDYPADHPIHGWVEDSWNYEVVKPEEIDTSDILKFFFVGPHENLLELEKEIRAKLGDSVNYAFTLPTCFEVFPKNITKAHALEELSKIKHLDLSNAVAFGDGFNDVEMLRLVKKGYIMGNAPDKLKLAMKDMEVVDTNANNGLQKKVSELFDLGE